MNPILLAATTVEELPELSQVAYKLLSGESGAQYLLDLISSILIITQADFNLVIRIYEFLIPIAYALAIIYFLMDLIDKFTLNGKNVSLEQYILCIFRFLLIYVLLDYGVELLRMICEIGNALVQYWLDNPIQVISTDTEDLLKQAKIAALDEGLLIQVAALLVGFVYSLLALVPTFLITLQAISRKMEIIIRGGFACMAIPDLMSEGKNSSAIRFIKKFAALLIHGSIMVLIVGLSAILSQNASLTTDESGKVVYDLFNIGTIIMPLLYSFASVGMLSASKAIVNEALGV